MKLPLSWLKQYLNADLKAVEVAEALTMAGLEVDKIEETPVNFTGVVIGKVLSVAKHPNADKLCVATVTDGKEQFQVVCGDPSCREGLITAFAKIGAALPEGEGKTWKIKKGKIRDVESFGMLCSEKELGISDNGEKIMDFTDDLPLGSDLAALYADPVLEISLTPNLGHCMSVIGIARELSAWFKIPLTLPKVQFQEDSSSSIEKEVSVEIEDQEQCLRYSTRMLKNITVGPSPLWLKKWLEASGVRSINNIVDVGNFVMLEYGQPLHMFDADKIAGKKIIVSSTKEYHTLKTLDDKLRSIPKGTLLICDQEKALAIAGVMGGEESAVSETTKNVLIESAYFTPQAIRRSSKMLNLRTEGSQRWERGVDPQVAVDALERATMLIQELAGGSVVKGRLEKKIAPFAPRRIICRVSRVNRLIGLTLSLREVAEILERLQMKVKEESSNMLEVEIPSFRNDITTEIDLVEEVARIFGYNHIPKPTPKHVSSNIPDDPIYLFEREMRARFMGEGLQDCMTCDLISPALAELTVEASLGKEALIHVLHPSSVDQSVLRTTLLPGLLQVVKFNCDHQNKDISAFEVGRIHFKEKEQFKEMSSAAVILSGKSRPYHWDPKPKECDFYDLKGIVENILDGLGIGNVSFETSHLHNFHPGRQARIRAGGIFIGALGEIHPAHVTALGIGQRVLFSEINLQELLPMKKKMTECAALPPFPGSERDWTITLEDSVPIGHVFEIIRSIHAPLLESVILLDIYKSEQIGKDKKNVTFRFYYRDLQKTISLESVELEHAKITQEVAEKLRIRIM